MVRSRGALALISLATLAVPAAAEERWPRVAREAGLGVLGAVGGGFAGAALGCVLARRDREFGCLGAAALGGVVGASVGMGAGVAIGGWDAGGSGLGLVGGELLGITAATSILVGVEALDVNMPGWLGVSMFVLLPLTGAIVGYELGVPEERRAAEGAASAGLRLRGAF